MYEYGEEFILRLIDDIPKVTFSIKNRKSYW